MNLLRLHALLAVSTVLFLAGDPARAQLTYEVIGNGFTGRPAVLAGDIVMESNGLEEAIRDFSAPAAAQWVGWNNHAVTSHWSYVIVDDDLVVGVNTDPLVTQLGFSVNTLTLPGTLNELSVTGSILGESAWLRGDAFLLNGLDALIAYDLTTPSAPAISGVVPVGNHAGSRWPSELGDVLYLLDTVSTVRVLDVSNPFQPGDSGTLPPVSGRIDAMASGAGVLYLLVTEDDAGGDTVNLVTWDVDAAEPPIETSRLPLFTSDTAAGQALALADDLLLVSASDGAVRAFGLANPSEPAPGWSLDHDTSHMVISDQAIFVATFSGIHVYERTGHDVNPEIAAQRTFLTRFATVVGDGPTQLAQLFSDRSVLVPVNASEPTQPYLETPIQTEWNGVLSYADGVGLMRKGDTKAQLLDLADPHNPSELGDIDLPDPGAFVKLYPGGVVLLGYTVADRVTDLYDVRDPYQPLRIATLPALRILFCDGLRLVCIANRYPIILTYDLDSILRPIATGTIEPNLRTVFHAFAVDDFIYLFGENFAANRVIEVYRDGNPSTLLRTIPLSDTPIQVDTYRDHMYVQGNHTCAVFDISDPAEPRAMRSFPAPREGGAGFAVNGDVATISSRLITVRSAGYPPSSVPPVRTAAGVALGPARPNPFNPNTTVSFVTDRARNLTVAIYDSRGRLVAEVARGHFEAGEHVVTWDGQANGYPAASGVYYFRVLGIGVEAVRSVTMLK